MPASYTRRSVIGLGVGLLVAGVARAVAAVASPGSSPGPAVAAAQATRLLRFPALGSVPDVDGFLLPPHFASRVIALSGQLIVGTSYTFLNNPDGAGMVPRADGGWWLLWNGESSNGGGGVAALRFDVGGALVAAQGVLTGLNRACAGGVTPWDTWLACEEVDHGTVW